MMSITSQEVINILRKEFPADKIQKRKGSWNAEKKAYDEYTYVAAEDITERLNDAFGLAWSLELSVGNELPSFVVEDSKKDKHIVVAAVIEYVDPDSGQRFRKTGFGGKKITTDLGNDFKGCLSKAMSNAAKKMGVAVVGDEDVIIPDDAPSTTVRAGIASGGVTPTVTVEKAEEKPPVVKKGIGAAKSTEPVAEKKEEAVVPKKGLAATKAAEVKTEAKSATSHNTLTCSDCSGEIVSAPTTDGKIMEPSDIANISKTFFKRELCNRCMKVAKEQMKKAD